MSEVTNQRLRALAALLGVPAETFGSPVEPYLLYSSENDDCWLLRRGQDGASIVQHVGNAASGGHITEYDVLRFLKRDEGSPQHQALCSLIEQLLIAHLVAG